MSLDLSRKPLVLITGVSRERGLGFETARQLGRAGFVVLITSRDPVKSANLSSILSSEGLDTHAAELDVHDDGSVARLSEHVRDTFGRLDVLINNANSVYDAGGKPLSTDIDLARQAIETNLFGAWRMAKAFAPLLLQGARGRIVNVGSGAGTFSDGFWGLSANDQGVPAYAISKTALHALTVKLAWELKSTSVLVNAVCPGFVATFEGTEAFGARPVSEGASGIVWAATLPADGPTGGLFRDGQRIAW